MKRYSKKREAIIDAIRSTDSHPSADWIYAKLKPQFPDLSLATVYRNIAGFLEDEELKSVGFVKSCERFDGRLSQHAHFICDCCGSVIDVETQGDDRLDEIAARETGADVMSHELIFRGVCKNCREKNN